MSTTLTKNLKLRLSSDLTADARYNLERIDTLGATFIVNTAEDLQVRAREQIYLQPRSPDLQGSGSGARVFVSGSLEVSELLEVRGAVQFDEMRLYSDIADVDNSEYSALRAAAGLASSTTWTMPVADGAASQVMTTDGAGQLGWATVLTDALNENNVRIGGASSLAVSVDTSSVGDILGNETNGLTYKAGSIVNEDVAAAAAVERSKLANGSGDHVLINTNSGVMSSEPQLAVSRGGTAAADAPTARTNLGLEIGTDVQAQNADLQSIADLSPSENDLLRYNGGVWTAIDAAALSLLLGLGTMAVQDADSVAITGGAIDGVPIGATTPSTIDATSLEATSIITPSLDVPAAAAFPIGATVGANNLTLGAASSTVVIPGNLQVDGTTTSVNSTTLEVTDANITVNNNGNQASADDVAGLTVEMSDATDAKLIYDKDATSRWRIGDEGSEVEVADISSAQTFTNKTITGARHTASNWTTSTTTDVSVEVFDIDTGATQLMDSIVRTDANTVTITASTAPTGSGRRVLIKEVGA